MKITYLPSNATRRLQKFRRRSRDGASNPMKERYFCLRQNT